MARLIEVFIAGCPLCNTAVSMLRDLIPEDVELRVYNIAADEKAYEKALHYGVSAVPAIVIDGRLVYQGVPGRNILEKALKNS